MYLSFSSMCLFILVTRQYTKQREVAPYTFGDNKCRQVEKRVLNRQVWDICQPEEGSRGTGTIVT